MRAAGSRCPLGTRSSGPLKTAGSCARPWCLAGKCPWAEGETTGRRPQAEVGKAQRKERTHVLVVQDKQPSRRQEGETEKARETACHSWPLPWFPVSSVSPPIQAFLGPGQWGVGGSAGWLSPQDEAQWHHAGTRLQQQWLLSHVPQAPSNHPRTVRVSPGAM